MQEGLLPLFPLQLVLLPRTLLPLHIYEERYKEMIAFCIQEKEEFGIVQAAEKGIVNLGCTGTVEKILKKYPDGRMDIIVLGRRRFEVILLNDEKPYLRGAVQFFDDEEAGEPSAELRERVVASYNLLRKLEDGSELPDIDFTDSQVSFQLGQAVPDLELRQVLLAAKSESERIRLLSEFLPGYVANQRYTERMKSVIPRNGHSKNPPSLA